MRQVMLDTETTGLEPEEGHRVIEIGGVEVVNRLVTGRHYHTYINPDRELDKAAQEVHGISREFLADKPTFGLIVQEFLAFVEGAELVIHNAPFDIAFLDSELSLLDTDHGCMADYCTVVDSLEIARRRHPGQKNSLDALCRRYQVDNSHRELHGALLDAELLAEAYLLLTGGQVTLALADDGFAGPASASGHGRIEGRSPGKVIAPSGEELRAHEDFLKMLAGQAEQVVWYRSQAAKKQGD